LGYEADAYNRAVSTVAVPLIDARVDRIPESRFHLYVEKVLREKGLFWASCLI